MAEFLHQLVVTLPPIIMEVENGGLEDDFSLQIGHFPLNHGCGRKANPVVSSWFSYISTGKPPESFCPSTWNYEDKLHSTLCSKPLALWDQLT